MRAATETPEPTQPCASPCGRDVADLSLDAADVTPRSGAKVPQWKKSGVFGPGCVFNLAVGYCTGLVTTVGTCRSCLW